MSEQMTKLVQFLQGRIRTVAFLVAAALLALMFYLSQSGAPTLPAPADAGAAGTPAAAEQTQAEALVRQLALNEAPIEDSKEYSRLMNESMFGVAAVREASARGSNP